MSVAGFTGTQKGMTAEQGLEVLRWLIVRGVSELHHGDCIGSDAECHTLARGIVGMKIVIHPPTEERKRAWCRGDEVCDVQPYIERNRSIVRSCDVLIACPKLPHSELRSGTWATIRYAKTVGRTVIIIWPNGNSDVIESED